MKEFDDRVITLLQTDLRLLHSKVHYYYINKDYLLGNDEELKSIWKLYADMRNRLLKLDDQLFASLRELELPTPDKSNSYTSEFGIYHREEHIKPLLDELIKASEYLKILENERIVKEKKNSPFADVELLAKRFHKIARQLRSRHANRTSILIEDEYDVQDLFHSLLNIYFDDIRPEEWTPSYAGSCSRMDFLLKNEKIVIEIKKTRKGLQEKEIGEQLIVDIGKYQSHPDCSTLFCFVYDPEGRVSNPIGIEKDLSKVHGKISVKAVIEPK